METKAQQRKRYRLHKIVKQCLPVSAELRQITMPAEDSELELIPAKVKRAINKLRALGYNLQKDLSFSLK